MTREEKLLKAVDKSARGIEIGPSHSPIASKRDGFRVTTIDTLSKDGLLEKYKDHGVKLENIEDVDFVWSGERYPALVGERNAFSWILASHVIEHTPNIVAFLEDCEALLSDTGVLSLAVPDKRFCFDHFRPISGLARILDSHYSGATHHTPGSVVEFMLNAVSKGGQIAWSQAQPGDFAFLCDLGSVLTLSRHWSLQRIWMCMPGVLRRHRSACSSTISIFWVSRPCNRSISFQPKGTNFSSR
jgi:hypothetical protein